MANLASLTDYWDNLQTFLNSMIYLTSEIKFQSTRSGGKGGQNVNKVETAVIAHFDIPNSNLLTTEQKQIILQKLANRINNNDCLVVKAQTFRTQLENKEDALKRVSQLVETSLKKKKARIATRLSKAAIDQRIVSKKRSSEIKTGRRKLRPGHFF